MKLLDNLKPKVAEAAIACIVTTPYCESDCITQALAGACPDPTAAETCGQIASTCSDAGVDAGSTTDCEKIVGGLTSQARADFVSCMTESYCYSPDPTSCLLMLP